MIGEQIPTKSGPLDFLGIDDKGNIVIVELKRDKLPGEALAQAIDYASDIAEWGNEKLDEFCLSFNGKNLTEVLSEKFPEKNFEDITVNQAQRLLLVGFSVDDSLSRMIEWLSSKYNLGINAIILNYIKTQNGDELLSRTVIIPEEIEREKTNKKKFAFAISNEPGTYDNDTLKEKLKTYLSKNIITCQRLREIFIPVLLNKGMTTREQMRKEFVNMGGAPDESQAGYFLSLISLQLGLKTNDFLRQVIGYEFPNYSWEKNNFRIMPEYKTLVEEVLNDIKSMQ